MVVDIINKINMLEYHTNLRMTASQRVDLRSSEFFNDLRDNPPSNILWIPDMLAYSKDIFLYLYNEYRNNNK